jgi:hypothetical protein
MQRVHKVWLSNLACLAFRLNAELDKGSFLSLDDAFNAYKTGVIAFIRARFGETNGFGVLDAEDDITISEYFGRVSINSCPRDFDVDKNGLCWLLALTVEMIQQQEWTDFGDPGITYHSASTD